MEEPKKKYILLRDCVGNILERNTWLLGLTTKSTPIRVPRGELLEAVPQTEQPSALNEIALVGIENKSLRLECRTDEELAGLSDQDANLLLAISSKETRYQTYTQRNRLAFGRQLLPGSDVFVSVKGIPEDLPGVVRYKGELPPSLGTWFGVELTRNPGQGTTDGTFRNKQYFICETDTGVFVGLDKLRPEEDLPELKSPKTNESSKDLTDLVSPSLQASRSNNDQKSSQGTGSEHSIGQARAAVMLYNNDRKEWEYFGGSSGISRVHVYHYPVNFTYRIVGRRMQDHMITINCALSRGLKYNVTTPRFHQWRDQRQVHGLNFPSKEDAQVFEQAVNTALENLRRSGSEKQEQSREIGNQLTSSQNQEREREMEQQITHLQAQLREKESREANLLREKDQQEENSRRQLREMEQQLTDVQEQLREKNQQLLHSEEQLQEMGEQLANVQGQLSSSEVQLEEMNHQLATVYAEISEKDNETAALQERLRVTLQQVGTLEEQLRTKDQEMSELELTLSTAQQALNEYQCQQSPDWVISRDQIQLTDKILGRGGWGSVVEGKYCGCTVAVKQMYELILSPHNRSLFEREMDIASRCRHPCLLQFIGATNDEGSPLFVTELMESSLRALLEQRSLSTTEVFKISLDVAQALNYLHQKKPSPIIHRDISSANVLLWRQGDQWRGKVSDYGTANFIQQTMTVAPGAMIYSAPEAVTSNQTDKVDVYSFGVLLCEICIRELPDPQKRGQQVARVTNRVLRALIRGCLQPEAEARPSMEEIVSELELPV